MILSIKKLAVCLVCAAALVIPRIAEGQQSHAEVLANLNDGVVGVAYLDLEKLDFEATIGLAKKLGFQERQESAQLLELLPMIKPEIESLKSVGVSRIYAFLQTRDIQSAGTSWLLPLKPGSNPDVAKRVLSNLIEKYGNSLPMFSKIDSTKDALIVAAEEWQVESLKADSTARDFSEMWDSIGEGTIGLAVFGDDDSRRVVRELMPNLPSPFESVTGRLVADGIKWGGVALTIAETPGLKIELESMDEQSAVTAERSINQGLSLLQMLPGIESFVDESEIDFVFESIKPVRDGNRVSISIEQLTTDMDRFAKIVAPQVRLARGEAAKRIRLQTLRQLALGMLNYESAQSHFPTQAIVNDQGNPLLSWRVQILPYIDQGELYDQFHLDEPWDSEHNIKLVEKMPKIYTDLSPNAVANNEKGKTIFQVAAGEQLIFDGAKEFGFGDLIDGSSNTILIATLAHKNAVIWTKPTDWQVDLEKPIELLQEEGRTDVAVSLADGSVMQLMLGTPADKWSNIIQPADENVVYLDEFTK